MSISKMQEFKRTGIDWTARLVGFMLADHLNDGTGRCDPSVALLSAETGLDERSVSRAIKRLEKAGHITVLRGSGVRNSYRIHPIQATELPSESHPRQKVTPGTESPPPPAQSQGNPRHADGTPPSQSRPNHKESEENHKSNHKEPSQARSRGAILQDDIRDAENQEIPLELDTDDFRNAWSDWCQYRAELYRRDKKKPWTGLAAKKTLNECARRGVLASIAAIDGTISNSWRGLVWDKFTWDEPQREPVYQQSETANMPWEDFMRLTWDGDEDELEYAIKVRRELSANIQTA